MINNYIKYIYFNKATFVGYVKKLSINKMDFTSIETRI